MRTYGIIGVILDLIVMGAAVWTIAYGVPSMTWTWIALLGATTLLIKDVTIIARGG